MQGSVRRFLKVSLTAAGHARKDQAMPESQHHSHMVYRRSGGDRRFLRVRVYEQISQVGEQQHPTSPFEWAGLMISQSCEQKGRRIPQTTDSGVSSKQVP